MSQRFLKFGHGRGAKYNWEACEPKKYKKTNISTKATKSTNKRSKPSQTKCPPTPRVGPENVSNAVILSSVDYLDYK